MEKILFDFIRTNLIYSEINKKFITKYNLNQDELLLYKKCILYSQLTTLHYKLVYKAIKHNLKFNNEFFVLILRMLNTYNKTDEYLSEDEDYSEDIKCYY